MSKLLICLTLTVCVTNIVGPNGQSVSADTASPASAIPSGGQQLTTLFGKPIGDKVDSLTVGFNGPQVLSDVQFLEEMAHFNRERIPERIVHSKGTGAFGEFVVTKDITHLSKAAMFSAVGKKTEAAVRFSVGLSDLGSADTPIINNRGIAFKFYTEEGNWDSVSFNMPAFLIRDPIQFPSLIHSAARSPGTGRTSGNTFIDFLSRAPESLNGMTFILSEAGTPDGYVFMDGHSINVFKLVNSQGQHVYVKFHWLTNQGVRNLTIAQAISLSGSNPDYSNAQLYNTIASGNFPSWTLWIQTITEEQAQNFTFNPFDTTKIWSEVDFPLQEVGVVTLNRNPSNFFQDVEQMALCPANLVPGIEPSPDKVLIGRMMAYSDAHRYRLGINHNQIPVNRPKVQFAITQRDGFMNIDNYGSLPNYYPNSDINAKVDPKFLDSNFTVPAGVVYRYSHADEDNYSPTRAFFQSFTEPQKQVLFQTWALFANGISPVVLARLRSQLRIIDPTYEAGVVAALAALNNSTSSK